MKYFNNTFFKFFAELEQNNSKEWFDANRETYEEYVKKPFRSLVEATTERLSKDFPELNRNVSKSIFRINRDIRFSADKTPYKTHVAAVFSRGSTTDREYPGFYLHLGSKEFFTGGGLYMLDKKELAKVRQEIYYNPEEFKKVINNKTFKAIYKEIKGDKNKVLEPEYKEFAKEQPLIANKGFYFMTELKKKEVTADNFDEILYKEYFKPAYEFNAFLLKALSKE